MAVDGVSPAIAIRSSSGIELWASSGLKSPYEPKPGLPREDTKIARSIAFSSDGRYLAYTNGAVVKLVSTDNWQEQCSLPRPKAFYLKFSPRGNYLATWELFTITKTTPEGSNNLFVYKTDTGEELYSTVQKKQSDWEPSWSNDESIFSVMIGGEALFYELGEGTAGYKSYVKKLGGVRGGAVKLLPGNSPPYLTFCTPGAKGGPSMCKIFKYPALESSQAVACKSFFQADHVEVLPNKRGTGVLLLTSTEVDKTGASYYGNQALHFMSTKGDSCSVTLGKDGPIHSVQWTPKGNEFVVVYGYMPSKATMFNLKCDVVHEFGEGPRNCAYFNTFGTLLILAGFGNLRGVVEVWDLSKKTKVSTLEAPDSTLLEWGPNGEHFVTATTAPRLRISNGFKIWHYSGALLHETLWPEGQELLDVKWQVFAEGAFKENTISNVKIDGIKSIQPLASKQVYQPPNVRLMREGKNPGDSVPQPSAIPGLPPGYTSVTQKAKAKAKAVRERKLNKAKKENNANNVPAENSGELPSPQTNNGATPTNNRPPAPRNQQQQRERPPKPRRNTLSQTESKQDKSPDDGANTNGEQQVRNGNGATAPQPRPRRNRTSVSETTGDPEKDKRLRTIHNKLAEISKLKSRQKGGATLAPNQVTKIATESALLDELKALKISS